MRKTIIFLTVFIFLSGLLSNFTVNASTLDSVPYSVNIYDMSINQYSEYEHSIVQPYNLQIDPSMQQGAYVIGAAASSFFSPMSIAIAGGTAFVLYLGYRLYENYKSDIDSNGNLRVTSDMLGSMRTELNSILGEVNVLEFTGSVPIPTKGTITATNVVNQGIHLPHTILSTTNVFVIKDYIPERVKLKSYCSVSSSSATEYILGTDYFISNFMLLPVISCDYWSPTDVYSVETGFRCSYDYVNNGGITINYFDYDTDLAGTTVDAYIDYELVDYSNALVEDLVLEDGSIGYEINVPSELLETPLIPNTDTEIPMLPGTVFKPPTISSTTPIIDIPLNDVIDVEPSLDTDTDIDTDPSTNPYSGLAEILEAVFGPLFDFIANFFSKLAELFKPLFDWIAEFFTKMGDLLETIFKPLFDFISNLWTKFVEVMLDLFRPTIDLSEAFSLPKGTGITPITDINMDQLLNITPKPIKYSTVISIGTLVYSVNIDFEKVDVIMNNITLIRNLFSYTLLLLAIFGIINLLMPKRVMD